MRIVILAAALAIGSPAFACDVFKSELSEDDWNLGERIARYDTKGYLTITSAGTEFVKGRKAVYWPSYGAGTGIPYRLAANVADDKDVITVRRYKSALIVDMEVFEPICQ